MYDDRVYSFSGPHLSAPGRDRLGWLPMDRVFTARNADPLKLTITSLSFNSATTSGYLMARVPIKTPVGEPLAYYTIECRNEFTDFDIGLNALGGWGCQWSCHPSSEQDGPSQLASLSSICHIWQIWQAFQLV